MNEYDAIRAAFAHNRKDAELLLHETVRSILAEAASSKVKQLEKISLCYSAADTGAAQRQSTDQHGGRRLTDHMICQNQDNHLLYALKHGRFWFWDKHQNKWVPSDFAAQQYAKAQTKEPDLTQEDWLGRCFGILKDDYEVPDAVVKALRALSNKEEPPCQVNTTAPNADAAVTMAAPAATLAEETSTTQTDANSARRAPAPLRALLLQCQACPMRKLPVRQRSLIIRGWMPKPLPTCTWPNRCTHRDASWPKWACAAWRMAFPLRTTHCASPLRQNVAMVRGRFPTAKRPSGAGARVSV